MKLIAITVASTFLCGLSAQADDRGAMIYREHCAACHAPENIMVASPKLGNASAWERRLEKGFDAVLANALAGVGAMPPKGMCVDCTMDDLEAAIRYMIVPTDNLSDRAGSPAHAVCLLAFDLNKSTPFEVPMVHCKESSTPPSQEVCGGA